MDADTDFRGLYGEVQRLLGRTLNTEELKILLGFVRYLGLPGDVISVLICYCKERARQRGSIRNPSLRTVEKEAYAWAERGIDTVEEAAAFISAQNVRNEEQAHAGNEGEDHAGEKARHGQLEGDGEKGLGGAGPQVAGGLHQAPVHLFSAGIHRQNHELKQGVHHAHHHGRVGVQQLQGALGQMQRHEHLVQRAAAAQPSGGH